MKITVCAYFPIGFAIGTNDNVFDTQRKSSLQVIQGAKLIERNNKRLTNRLGNGLTFDIIDSKIFYDWRNGIDRTLVDPAFQSDFEIDSHLLEDVNHIMALNPKFTCQLGLFSCGMGTIDVAIENIPDDANPIALFRIAQAVEYSAYSDYASNTDFHDSLLKFAKDTLLHFNRDENLAAITTLPQSTENFKYNFFPSFTIIFNSSSEKAIKKMNEWRTSKEDGFISSSYDGHAVYSSWYTILENSDGADTTVKDLIRTYSLFYGASEMMVDIMNNVIYDLLDPEKSGDKLELLIKLQLTGNLIINNTSMNFLTQNEELMAIFRKLNKNGNLENFHNAIKRSLEVCTDIKSQFTHELEKLENEEDKRRDDRINFFVIIFTSFTFVSVAADFMNLGEFTSVLIADKAERYIIYFSVLAAFVAVICYLFFRKKPLFGK